MTTKQTSKQKLPPLPRGEWLVNLNGEILGPVPASEIYDFMKTGEVDESTKISLEEGEWRTLRQLRQWHPFLYQAKALLRQKQAQEEAALALRKRRIRKIIKLTSINTGLVLLSFLVSYWYIINRSPERDEQVIRAWAKKHVPLLNINYAAAGQLETDPGMNDEPELASISTEIVIVDAPDLVGLKPEVNRRKRKRKKKTTSNSNKKASKTTEVASLTPKQELARVRAEIMQRVHKSHKFMNRLKSCLMAEIRRNEDLTSPVVLSFSIRNDGTIHNVQVDDIRLENGPLHQCFRKRVQRLRFSPFSESVQTQNITLPFNWKG